MGWQTSRGFVTSRERIQRIDDIPDISGYQTTGAVVKYADKDDFPALASLMGMEAELYSKWEFNGQLHIMLNTDMHYGPYQFKRTGGNIFITFYPEFHNKNDSDFKAVPVAGLAQTTMGSYFTAIKAGLNGGASKTRRSRQAKSQAWEITPSMLPRR